MAGEIARAAVEAGTKAVMDLSLSVPGCSISLKIDNVWLAGAVSIGALSLGAYYLANKGPSEDAIRRALQRIDTSGVANPEVRNITDGSILVELHCHTETSFLLFLEDFEKKTVKFRLEEEFKKIGFKDELDVTIRNAEAVYEKARQIREKSRAPREGEETGWSAAQRQRLAVEKSVLESYFRNKVTWIDPTRPGQTKVEVQMTCTNDKQYTLRVYIPSDYPNSCPDMVVKTPSKLKARNGENLDEYQGDNHIGRTRDGYTGICHFRPSLWQDNNTLYQVFMKGLIWLEAYEAHLRTGQLLHRYLSEI